MKVTSPALAFKFFRARFNPEIEEVWALALSSEKFVLACELLFRGTVDQCLIHPRDIFRFALKHNATSFILAHNHPTGVAYPSEQDILLTKRFRRLGRLMQIPLEDHIILAGARYYSFAERRNTSS